MQTAPKGTYTGMVQCAGGILKNEGPLAFYKVCYINAGERLYLISMYRGPYHHYSVLDYVYQSSLER